jgi:hypothetical protein
MSYYARILGSHEIIRNNTSLRNGSKSIGFAWGRVQSDREDMPRGPCNVPEA